MGHRLAVVTQAAGFQLRMAVHSGRVGLASELTNRGASTTAVMLAGDWKTSRWGAPSYLGHGLGENPMSQEVGGMVQSNRVKGSGSARTEGARRPTGVGADGAAVGSGALAPGQRLSASRKRDMV